MPLTQLIYASQPFGFDPAMLAGILMDARRYNARDDVTGALIVRGDMYLQLLEGPKPKVEATYDRIIRDDRHVNPVRLMHREVQERMFPEWSMLDDPAKSWVWSIAEVRGGALERFSAGQEALKFFQRLAASRLDTAG
ncbi:BLUF domain-containing protein [uncultured Roseovarius sp.]|uniref:BLUF domain-containing protein n=1 Tax=uncultured Roseovarius sp. TaxID=293344 RepID=UPI000C6B1775|nr:blue light sensor protein [Roseovarius sp.]|tara:strand:- start:955 stop:1368 length:414 start_codon:yes stop_codon:yes gene_type:complete